MTSNFWAVFRSLLVFFCFFLEKKTLDAQVLTTADVLATAGADLRLRHGQALQNTAQGLRMHDPLVQQIAARVGVNGSALGDTIYGYLRNEDTYQLQVRFNSWGERQRQRHIKTARVQVLATEARVLQHEALAERYTALAAYLFADSQLRACRRLDTLLEKEHQILRDMLTSGILEVKVSKVLDAEENRNRNRLDLEELESAQLAQKTRLAQLVGAFDDIDRRDLVGILDLRAQVATLKNTPAQPPVFAVKNADIGLETANLNYVNAQNRQIFNHLMAGYQYPLYLERPKRFNTFNNISFRVGLTVPLPGNNRFKKADALLDLREAQNSAAWAQQKHQQDLENQFVRIDNLFREYDFLQDRLDHSLIKKMLDNPTLRAQISPLEIVELEIAQQKMVVTQTALLADIANEYIRLINLMGVVGMDTNYLSK
jgi:hypothetical protein